MISLNTLIKTSHDLSVLYVEDDPYIRQEMYEVLENFFSVVLLAEDGLQGFRKFQAYNDETGSYPDIIITDISMPKWNGIEMSKKIFEHNAEQSIVILSAHNDAEHLYALINMGIEHYVLKPVASEQLLQVLQRAVKKIHYRKMELQYTMELEKLAYLDFMTGISNRRRFFEKTHAFFTNRVFASPVPFYLLMIDIDKFKSINDTYGHDMGDAVIQKLVEIVKENLDTNSCFARFGGDEFVVMIQKERTEVLAVAAAIQNDMRRSHALLDKRITFAVSIGLTEIVTEDQTIDAALKRADIALYNEKVSKSVLPRYA